MTDREFTGVWISDVPLDPSEGAWGEAVLVADLSISEDEAGEWEWVEDGKPYREWLLPADLLNSLMVNLRLLDESEVE